MDAPPTTARPVPKLCELGVTGLTVPEEYGGGGVDILAAIV